MKMSSYLLTNHLPPFPPISLNLYSNSISKPKSSFSFPISAKPKSSFPFSPSFKVSSLLPASPPSSNFRLQSHHSISKTFHSLNDLKPFIISQHKPILLGWLCSLVSVYSLSNIVISAGKFSSFMRNYEAIRLSNEGLILGIFVMARLVACYWQQAFLWEAALRVGYEIRVRVFKKVLERDLGFFEGREGVSSGDIAYRITAEASDIADTVYALLNTIVPSILQLSAMAVQMLAISLVMSLISALVLPFMAFAIACLGEKLRKISSKAHLTIADLSAYLNEMFPAILFVKANNAEFCENARFERFAHADLFAHMRKKKMKALIPQITQIIYFGSLFLFFVSSLAISTSSIDICSMVSFLASLVFLIEPIQGVGKAYNELKQGEPAIERLFDLTRFKPVVMEKPSAVDLKHVTGDLQFCNISFKYEENMPLVLNGLNLHIKAGETVALVGPSGGGKTTLVKLLLRLYDPSSGSIYMDNHDIQNIKLKSLRRHVGLVSQDITLFSGTVAENIGYKDLVKNIDMERVKHAARTANADEFIKNLPEGYKTYIGLRGSMLSGGQKQRIAIARALYQDSSILILDEATSALDSRSELLVRQAVQQLMENHTVLVIAHRLETVLMAKRIFHLEGGKLDELTHSTLLSGRSTGLVI